jgi:hypothetical protein
VDPVEDFFKSSPPAPPEPSADVQEDEPLSSFDPHPRPLRWAIPALTLTLTSALVVQSRADFDYLVAAPAPVDLGVPGDYHLERAQPGLFVRIEGETGPEASSYRKAFTDRELLPLVEVPVIADRPHSAPALVLPHRLPMRLRAEGRLEPEVQRPQFRDVIRYFLMHDELAPPSAGVGTSHVWILSEGDRPRALCWNTAWCAWLIALLAFNVVWLWRRLAR